MIDPKATAPKRRASWRMRGALLALCVLSFALISCPPGGIQQPPAIKTQTVSLADIPPTTLAPDATVTVTAKVNASDEKNTYTIYKLPYINTDDSASTLRLTVMLGSAAALDLQTKGYFSVVSNAGSDAANPYSYVQRSLQREEFRERPQEPFTILSPAQIRQKISGRQRRSITAQSAAQDQQQYFNSLTEYSTGAASTTAPSTRTFNFDRVNGAQPTATLYKKLEFTYEGQTLRFAIWLDDSGYSAAQKNDAQTNIDAFADIIYNTATPTNNSVYKMLYALNGGHIWGPHGFSGVAARDDSVIHVGFGKISAPQFGTVDGFVDARTLFYHQYVPTNPESIVAPTIALGHHLLESIANKSLYSTQNMYKIFAHEAQHAFTNYHKMIRTSGSNLFALNRAVVDTWVHETLSLMAEYFTGINIFKLTNPTSSTIETDYQKFMQFNHGLLRSSLFNTGMMNNANFNFSSYVIAFAFGAYLAQNYGSSILERTVNQRLPRGQTFAEAAKSTPEYSRLPAHLRPSRIEDMVLDFFISLFVSDNIRNAAAASNYKFFTYDNNPNILSFDYTDPAGVKHADLAFGNVVTLQHGTDASANSFPVIAFDAANLPTYQTMPPPDIPNTWRKGLGPFIFDPPKGGYYPQAYGQHAVLYLGGRVNKSGTNDKAGEPGSIKTDENGNAYVQFELGRGVAAAIIAVE